MARIDPAITFCEHQRDGAARHGGDPGAWRHDFTEKFLVSRFYRSARYGTLGGGTIET
jgi:hypothetical protein